MCPIIGFIALLDLSCEKLKLDRRPFSSKVALISRSHGRSRFKLGLMYIFRQTKPLPMGECRDFLHIVPGGDCSCLQVGWKDVG
jgi:hypothetical protein